MPKIDYKLLVSYVSISLLALGASYVVIDKQVAEQPTRITKQVVYHTPPARTPVEQKAEVQNMLANIITDKINKKFKGVDIETSITKDGWAISLTDDKGEAKIQIGGTK